MRLLSQSCICADTTPLDNEHSCSSSSYMRNMRGTENALNVSHLVLCAI